MVVAYWTVFNAPLRWRSRSLIFPAKVAMEKICTEGHQQSEPAGHRHGVEREAQTAPRREKEACTCLHGKEKILRKRRACCLQQRKYWPQTYRYVSYISKTASLFWSKQKFKAEQSVPHPFVLTNIHTVNESSSGGKPYIGGSIPQNECSPGTKTNNT